MTSWHVKVMGPHMNRPNMNIRRFAVALLIFPLSCRGIALEGNSPCSSEERSSEQRSSEQTHFSAEDDRVEKPVAIPVLTVLSQDNMVRAELENENIPAEKLPQSWFAASAIHLTHSGEIDLIVVSVGPVRGANVTMFWVFRSTPHGHELVLTAGAHDLQVKSTFWKGYRDIELLSVTMQKLNTVLYKFNGKRYVRYKDKVEDIR
jgi:hypothetical protein